MAPVRYTFDTTFGDDSEAEARAEMEALERKVRAAEAAGRTQGLADGRAEALAGIEAQMSATLERVLQACTRLLDTERDAERALEAEAAQIAHAMASRLAPALMRAHPLAEIEALVSECLDGCRREPRIVIRVHAELVEPLSARLEALKAASNYTGQVILIEDPALGPSDCRVEWPDGGAERDMDAVEQAISRAVERFVMRIDGNIADAGTERA